MSFALIFDNSKYQFARLVSKEKNHCVIQLLDSTTDKKIKSINLIYEFAENPTPNIQALIEKTKNEIDLELLWESSNDKTSWDWQELVTLYFGETNTINELAIFLAASDPEIFFKYEENKAFKRCGLEEVNLRKLQVKKQKEYQAKFEQLYNQLFNLAKPDWNIDPHELINKPDKNSLEYKVCSKVAKDLNLSLVELFFKVGYITSIEELLLTSFKKQYFRGGVQLPDMQINDHSEDIQVNTEIQVFSIDDTLTTEIDDAFSVTRKANGWDIGIHISAPSLNYDLLEIASERMSTVYYPGHKITMLPQNVIEHYSLERGKLLPVVSIYFTIDSEFNIINTESKIERVIVESNLRIEALEQQFNMDKLSDNHGYPYELELKLLYQFALKLEEKRGRASVNQLNIDYNFSFDNGKICIKPRIRGNPIDKLVSELMILANCSWGRMLTNAFIPAIYRVKQPMQPVTMTLTPNSHTGLNVDYYTWASSPLRRAVDLVNQSQIISLIQQKKPLSATDIPVANVVENFDSTYNAYLKFQDSLERYWSLRYLEQEKIQQINATFTYRNNVQLDGVPIVLDVGQITKAQTPGSEITLLISNFNFVNQTFDYKLLAL